MPHTTSGRLRAHYNFSAPYIWVELTQVCTDNGLQPCYVSANRPAYTIIIARINIIYWDSEFIWILSGISDSHPAHAVAEFNAVTIRGCYMCN